MSTPTFQLLKYFCPYTSNEPIQTIQKKFNHSQLIQYKKEFIGNRKYLAIQKSKLSLSQLKKQKPKDKVKNTTFISQNQVNNHRQQLFNTQLHNNFYCNKSFDCKPTQNNVITIIEPISQKDISKSCRSVCDNKIVTRKLNKFQNNKHIISNNTLGHFKHRRLITSRNNNSIRNYNFIESNVFSQKVIEVHHQHKILLSQIAVKQQVVPIINSEQLTSSTNPSKQKILINQQIFQKEQKLQFNMQSPIFMKKQIKFPQGFRFVLSLQDNESLAQDLSIALDNLVRNQNKQAKTERKQQKNLRISNLSERQPYFQLDKVFEKQQIVKV